MPEGMRELGMGVIATTGGVALTFGPPIGGLLTAYAGWHWIFLINVPIGIAAIIFGRSAIPAPFVPAKLESFNFFGTFVLFFAIAGFILALERGPEFGWTRPEIVFFAGVTALCTTVSVCIRCGTENLCSISDQNIPSLEIFGGNGVVSVDLYGVCRRDVYGAVLHAHGTWS
ncbi:MAG: hypothetical protein MJ014_07270 [Methanocorpusculum sp.]|nr:hypothetical protein [Methanocorpusculum sp.]